MASNKVTKIALVLSTIAFLAPSVNAAGVKDSGKKELKVEAGSIRTAECCSGGAGKPPDMDLDPIRAHDLVSGKVKKHKRRSVLKKRAHNLVSGKVKKTNKKTGVK